MKAVLILFLLGLVSLTLGWQIVKIAGSLILGAIGIVFGIVAAVVGIILGIVGAFFGIGLLGFLSPVLLVAVIILGIVALCSIF